MKKKNYFIFGIFVAIVISFSFTLNADASVLDIVSLADNNCETLLGEKDNSNDPAYWLNLIMNGIKYVAIIALLLLVTVDFFKALVADDKDAVKKASKNAVKRFIYCVIIFFLPILMDLLSEMFGLSGTCGIGD